MRWPVSYFVLFLCLTSLCRHHCVVPYHQYAHWPGFIKKKVPSAGSVIWQRNTEVFDFKWIVPSFENVSPHLYKKRPVTIGLQAKTFRFSCRVNQFTRIRIAEDGNKSASSETYCTHTTDNWVQKRTSPMTAAANSTVICSLKLDQVHSLEKTHLSCVKNGTFTVCVLYLTVQIIRTTMLGVGLWCTAEYKYITKSRSVTLPSSPFKSLSSVHFQIYEKPFERIVLIISQYPCVEVSKGSWIHKGNAAFQYPTHFTAVALLAFSPHFRLICQGLLVGFLVGLTLFCLEKQQLLQDPEECQVPLWKVRLTRDPET